MTDILKDKKWVVFFSHTGSEINNISTRIGRVPDRVITNKSPGDKTINKQLMRLVKKDIVYTSNKPTTQDYERLLMDNCVVTLHGWMRIIPGKICKDNEIYNLHPGLITKYPELKGADPQKRVVDSSSKTTYKQVGCVIHKVTETVDDGEVLAECSCYNHYDSHALLSDKLHQMASDLWVDFLTGA